MTSQVKSNEPASGRKRRSGVVSMTMNDDPKRFLSVIHEELEGERSRPTSPSVRSPLWEERMEEKEEDVEVKPRTTRSYSSCRLFSPNILTSPGGRELELNPTRFDFGSDAALDLEFELFPDLSEIIKTKILGNARGGMGSEDDDDDDKNKNVTLRRDGSKSNVDSINDKDMNPSQEWMSHGNDYLAMLKSQRTLMKSKPGDVASRTTHRWDQADSGGGGGDQTQIPATAVGGHVEEGGEAGGEWEEASAGRPTEERDGMLGKLKETATRLNLPTRRPSYLAWRERYLKPFKLASSASSKTSSAQPVKSLLSSRGEKLEKLSPSDPSPNACVPGTPILKRLSPTTSPNASSPPSTRLIPTPGSEESPRTPPKGLRDTESNLPAVGSDSGYLPDEPSSLSSSSSSSSSDIPSPREVSAEEGALESSCKCGDSTLVSGCSVQSAGQDRGQRAGTYSSSVTLHLQRDDQPHRVQDAAANSSALVSSSKEDVESSRDVRLGPLGSTSQYCRCGSPPKPSSPAGGHSRPSEEDRRSKGDSTATTSPNEEESTSSSQARDSAYNSDDEEEEGPHSSRDAPEREGDDDDTTCRRSPNKGIRCQMVVDSGGEAESRRKNVSGGGDDDAQPAGAEGANSLLKDSAPTNFTQAVIAVSNQVQTGIEAGENCTEDKCRQCGKPILSENREAREESRPGCSSGSVETDPSEDKTVCIPRRKRDALTPEKKKEIDGKLEWIKNELVGLRRMDQSLARQLLNIHQDLCRMRLVFSCQEHRELLEDTTLDLAEVESLKRYLEYPTAGSLVSNPLRHIGVTKMNLVSRRFSTC